MRRQPFAPWIAVFRHRNVSRVRQFRIRLQHVGLLPVLASVVLCCGCANFYEKKAITAFQTGLEAGDLAALREKSTEQFQHRALRHPQADEALSQLKIPDGKFKITDVEDVSKTEKKVTVAFGEDQKRKILYRLVKDEKTKSWNVDDIYLRQRSGDKVMAMAVTEQMDVLLSAREFHEAWASGDRQQVLAKSDPQLAAELSQLPPAVLANYISRILGHSDNSRSFKPETHISGESAVVRLNRSHGTLVFSMEQGESGGWQVKDLSLESRGEEGGIASLTKTVQLTNRAMHFLEAWQQQDKEALKQITQSRFFKAGLAPANLAEVTLPGPYDINAYVEVKILDARADVVVNSESHTVRLTLSETGERTGNYEVSDVFLYNLENRQTLSLSSAMTARPVAELFIEALRIRDPKMLQYSSTLDLHKQTWNRMSEQTLAILPLPLENLENTEIIDTKFAGSVTQVVLRGGSQQLTLTLHDQNGKVLVDDLLISDYEPEGTQEPRSLKSYVAAIAPVYELAATIHHNKPQDALRLVTDDFYDRVFSLAQVMPESSYVYLDYVSGGKPRIKPAVDPNATSATSMKANLIQPKQPLVERFQQDEGDLLVEFSLPEGSMQVSLRNEQGLFRIDDAIISTPGNEVAKRLKQSMRMDIASSRTQNMIRTVSGEIRKLPKEMASKPAGASRPGGKAQLLDETTLTNALYEEHEHEQQRVEQTSLAPQPLSTADRQECPLPPRELPPEGHLLLKPIPLE
ncbi:MAG: hypothetical protein KDA76_08635 [Planctomycetaceae bacterium]|nr:hypothetical protein [Planctomycetaceae bacterium]